MTPTHFKAKREGMFVPASQLNKVLSELPAGDYEIVGDTDSMTYKQWMEISNEPRIVMMMEHGLDPSARYIVLIKNDNK